MEQNVPYNKNKEYNDIESYNILGWFSKKIRSTL